MFGVKTWKAGALGFPVILAIVLSILGASYLGSALVGLPNSVGLPSVVNLAGGVVVLAGLGVAVWTFKERSPGAVIVSTYFTLAKAFRRVPLGEAAGRTERLVVEGPQRYTRNPLYLGVVIMVAGWAFMTGTTYLFVSAAAFFLWFSVVLIPFEERELRSLFGQEWAEYSERTPMLIPFTKRAKRNASGRQGPSRGVRES